ncbi:MAG TPA: hypothetical protein VII81_14890 [Terriglobales bacterium]|jgi:hypothetical protein
MATENLTKSKTTPRDELSRDRPRVLDDLKSLLDSFAPKLRQHVIAEIHFVLAELTS